MVSVVEIGCNVLHSAGQGNRSPGYDAAVPAEQERASIPRNFFQQFNFTGSYSYLCVHMVGCSGWGHGVWFCWCPQDLSWSGRVCRPEGGGVVRSRRRSIELVRTT